VREALAFEPLHRRTNRSPSRYEGRHLEFHADPLIVDTLHPVNMCS
jgi:hypothetical protein